MSSVLKKADKLNLSLSLSFEGLYSKWGQWFKKEVELGPVNLVHFEGLQWDPYETCMMKLTCCNWDCLLEHGAHSRHITQIGMYFILRNN